MSWDRMLMRYAVLKPGLKPNSLSEIRLLLSRWCWMGSCIVASMTLLMLLSRENGRYLVASALESLFCIDVMEAIFHWLECTPLGKYVQVKESAKITGKLRTAYLVYSCWEVIRSSSFVRWSCCRCVIICLGLSVILFMNSMVVVVLSGAGD